MPNPVTTGLIPWAYQPTLAKMIKDEIARPQLVDQYLGSESYTRSPSKQQFITAGYVGYGPFQTHGEVVPLPFDSPGPDFAKATSYVNYGLATMLSQNALEDLLFPVYDAMGMEFAEAWKLLRELLGARFLGSANATTYFTSPDGKSVINSAHTTQQDGPVRTNTLATQASFSYQAMADMITVMTRQKDKRGYPRPAIKAGDRVTLMYQPEDWETVTRILSPLSKGLPGGNYNDPNAVTATYSFNTVVNPYLDVVNATGRPFFLFRDGDKSAYFVERREMGTASTTDPHTGHVTFSGKGRFGLHVEGWESYYATGFATTP